MIFNRLLLWLLRFIEPLRGWQVPVTLLEGTAQGAEGRAVLLVAGHRRRTCYFTERFFAEEPQEVKTARVPVWSLQRVLDQWQTEADLTIVEIDRLSARLFLHNDYLKAPPFVASWMQVPEDLKAFARHHGHAAADMQKVRNRPFESSLSREGADFDLFYDRFYTSYILKRHGVTASLAPRWYWRRLFRQGGIHWIMYEGVRVAADLLVIRGGTLHKLINGLRDGEMEWLRKGALAALYLHAIHLAKQMDCKRIHLGGSRASLHDGVLRYKCKWGGVICPYEDGFSTHYVTLFHWKHLAGPVAQFLSHVSLIHHEGGGLSALWVFPEHLQPTAENLTKECQLLQADGLKCFRVLMHGPPPSDFHCPPGIRLIDLRSVGAVSPRVWMRGEVPL
jgi:hypothetical protein